MKHIKNYLNENNTYGVEMSFTIDENENYVNGYSHYGTETKDEIKMIYDNLKRMGYIELGYNKPVVIGFVDGEEDIIDVWFQVEGEDDLDEDNTPVFQVTKESLKELGF
jgi:hypothetical protein